MSAFGNAVRTLLQPGWDAELRAIRGELQAMQSEQRALITELNTSLEKLAAWQAREAMRRSRALKNKLLEDHPTDEELAAKREETARAIASQPVTGAQARAAWKAELRARMTGGSLPLRPMPPIPKEETA